ncbi:hypothetical protein DFS34DRAFT_615147 [Phlyctochytrium arcticum]|nr:hypothetical protein DFS34DRAFT_615147 [Phlyctochytrium arcticum]
MSWFKFSRNQPDNSSTALKRTDDDQDDDGHHHKGTWISSVWGNATTTTTPQSQPGSPPPPDWKNEYLLLLLLIPLPFLHPRLHRRYKSAEFLIPPIIISNRVLRGVVTSVRDNDNFRLYHTPLLQRLLGLNKVPGTAKELQNETIHVRLAGIDAPEGAHFGMKQQPFHQESKAFLSDLILNRPVKIKILRRDHYGRIVSMAYVKYRWWPFWWPCRNVSAEMVKEGWATVYTQGGAEYDNLEDYLKKEEATAKRKKRGMWGNMEGYVSPAEHKKAAKKA